MSRLRSVSTKFWSDPFIEDLAPELKLLFLYLLTNEKTNMLGIYELSISKISFETGLTKDQISNGFESFERLQKVKYTNNYVVIINYIKHQNFNPNMMKSAIDVYNELPNGLKIKGLNISKDNPLEGFQSLSKGYQTVPKVKVKSKVEVEVEEESKEKENTLSSFLLFWNQYHSITGKPKTDRSATSKKWKALTITDQRKAFEAIEKCYKWAMLQYGNVQYVKKARTYLNDRLWEDDYTLPEKDPTKTYING